MSPSEDSRARDARASKVALAGLLLAVLGPAVLYTDAWDGGRSVFKLLALAVGSGVALAALAFAPSTLARIRFSPLDAAVAAYVLWTLVATAAAPEPLLSVTGSRPYWDGAAAAMGAAGAYLAARALLSARPAEGGRLVLGAAATFVVLLLALVPAVAGVPAFASLVRSGRTGSLMGQPTFLAGLAVTWLPLLALVSWRAWRSPPPGARSWILRAGAPAAAVLLAATLSRAGWLAAATALGLMAALSARRARSRALRLAAAAVVAAALLGGLAAARGDPAPGSSGFTAVLGRTGATRAAAWGYALREASAHPLTGSGPGTYVYTFTSMLTPRVYRLEPDTVLLDPHDWYLNAASATGVPGGLAALAVAACALALTWRLRGRPGPALAAASGGVGYLAHCVATPNTFATFAGALTVLAVAASAPSGEPADAEARRRRPPHGAPRVAMAVLGAVLALWGARVAFAESAYASAGQGGPSALGQARVATRLAPEVAAYHVRHARILASLPDGDPAEVARVLREARRRLPRDGDLALSSASVLFSVAGALEDGPAADLALRWLADGVRLMPAYPEPRRWLASELEARGDEAGAARERRVLRRQYGEDRAGPARGPR